MSCEIIQFSTAARISPKRRKPIASSMSRVELEHDFETGIPASKQPAREQLPAGSLSTTAKNGRLRDQRHDVWRSAEAATRYWKTRLDFEDAVELAQRHEVPEGRHHPTVDPGYRIPMVRLYREALVRQLLTPAWDTASVKWKKAALAQGQYRYIGVKPERIERAIADDLAFLSAHPVRQSKHNSSEAVARRREFKEAMRRRIRDVAASRDLSDEEIKPALTLKHQEIARFSEQHGVNIEWLLEGKGRIFEKDPITLGPNMSSAELAALVRTLPEAQQQKFEATVDRLLAEQAVVEPEPA